MTRTISYDTENTDDMLWALKRVVADMYKHNNQALEMLKKAVEEKGYPLYIGIPEREQLFKDAGIEIAGTVEDMIQEADVVVDCTPGSIGPQNLEMYKKAGVKAIYQGGEDHELTGLSFNSFSNYDDSYGKDYTRVVSCNTTGLTRTLFTIDKIADIKKVRAVMVRRGSDPSEVKKGPINAIVPNPPKVPSHHGPDVKTVMNGIDVTTMALLVPTTLMHQHNIMVEINNDVETEEIVEALEKRSRVIVVSAEEDGVSFVSLTDGETVAGAQFRFEIDFHVLQLAQTQNFFLCEGVVGKFAVAAVVDVAQKIQVAVLHLTSVAGNVFQLELAGGFCFE